MPQPLSEADFQLACNEICPHCRNGVALRYRANTQEWVHDGIQGSGHGICWANGLRKGAFAPKKEQAGG